MLATRILRSAAGGPKPNLTGFNIKEFIAHSKAPKYDPWETHEAWRYQGPYTRWNRFKGAFPGFGIASVAFAGYCTYEHFFMQDDHHHGADDHHAEGEQSEGH